MSRVIVLCTDKNYTEHVKYNINNIRDKHGIIDICILSRDEDFGYVQSELKDFDIFLKSYSQLVGFNSTYCSKYHIFDEFMTKWEKILYIDCDTMIYNNLDPLFDLLDNKDFFVDYEGITIKDFFTMWMPLTEDNKEIFDELNAEEIINKTGFNAGILLFNSSIIQKNTLDKLYQLHRKYSLINNHAQNGNTSDQPIINILFGDICEQVPNKYFSYWRDSDNNTLIDHFCRWDAPWINKEYSTKIGDSYLNYYKNKIN